jgi:hypothetical protein
LVFDFDVALTQDLGEPKQAAVLLERYCASCHAGETIEGSFEIPNFEADDTTEAERMQWEQIARVIDDGLMPPEDSAQPSVDEKLRIRQWIESKVSHSSNQVSLRRLNRVEYENTIRNLFELSRDGFSNPDKILMLDEYFRPERKKMPRYVFAVSHFSFNGINRPELREVGQPPVDLPAEHGFTNDSSVLKFSPLLAEKYLELASEIVNSPTLPVLSHSYESLFKFDHPESAPNDDVIDESRRRLELFLPRAFRRPVASQEIDRFVRVFEESLNDSGDRSDAMKTTVAAILVSPDFLFLFQDPGTHLSMDQRISIGNASRLSYFLWASMPDKKLLELAEAGELVTEQQLLNQAERMMLDPKIKSLATDFGMQWLKVNRLASSQPDLEKYAKYFQRKNQPIGIAMMIEQLLLFETVLVEDLSIMNFIDSDFAYVNRDLLYWYRLNPKKYSGFVPPYESKEDFFRINLPKDRKRGGAITCGATLVLTSHPLRTSPVSRGAWIAETIFNRPPLPPPPNVGTLDKVAVDGSGRQLSARERLDLHRKDPSCYSCHAKIDPLGFALEQFDAVGKFREKYDNGSSIDSSGSLDGYDFENAAEFKRTILESKKEKFARAFTEHMLRYAVNRRLGLADSDSVEQIAKSLMKNDFRIQALVRGIVTSNAFRTRTPDNEE